MTAISLRANELAATHLNKIRASTDRQFLWLTILEYIGAIVAASLLSPNTYVGSQSHIHPHVIVAITLGAVIAGPVVYATIAWPGRFRTRIIVAVCQMLMSALLIHISGGRIETHFHVFGTLAFLAFYRDWRILVPATLVVATDHIVRGIYLPESVYGVVAGAEWRFVEHAAWVIFEDTFLIISCLRGVNEVHQIAERQAKLEETNDLVAAAVEERTEELRESELLKSAVFENALDGILNMNTVGIVFEINPAAERIFGIERDQAIGKPIASLFLHGESQKHVNAMLEACVSEESASSVQDNIELIAGSSEDAAVPVEVSIISVKLKGIPVYTAFVRDVSERRQFADKLLHANKMESLGQLATGVAHEINTPNQFIGDNVRFVEESFGGLARLVNVYRQAISVSSLSEAERSAVKSAEKDADLEFVLEQIPPALEQALEGVDRVGSIIRAMKEFSHPGADSYTTVDLNRVIESTAMVARNEWKYVAELDLRLNPDIPHIQANQSEISQVILNLIVNAAQAIDERYKRVQHGRITIATSVVGDRVMVTVGDDGAGIPDSVKSRIFDPFYTTKGVGVGTGQGLTITRNIVERHAGEIRVVSKPGSGTVFSIVLPVLATQEEVCA